MDTENHPATPSWLAEALITARLWQRTGWLERLNQTVKVPRGRMGTYEVCDFVLLLLSYAVSGCRTLKEFFEQLEPVAEALMAVWDRQSCPHRSSLSRFLAAVDDEAVVALRELFEQDLSESGIRGAACQGLRDRCGEGWLVFDVDGTRQAARQRHLPEDEQRPPCRRRMQAVCAPGYSGRKRGEVTRTRTTVQQAHTQEWLGTFAGAGNGDYYGELQQVCGAVKRYMDARGLAPERAILRLDGLYGHAKSAAAIAASGLRYLVRCVDYRLLEHPQVQLRLQGHPDEVLDQEDPARPREVFELGWMNDWYSSDRSDHPQQVRLVALRQLADPHHPHAIGKLKGVYVYELFACALPPEGFSARDVVDFYHGRGAFEGTLAREDEEADGDRWCCYQPAGQSFWQILNQWVWNGRLRLGQLEASDPVRTTLWAPAQSSEPPPTLPVLPPAERPPEPPAEPVYFDPHFGPMQLVQPKSHLLKFSSHGFRLQPNGSVLCPAGKSMKLRERRLDRQGDLLVLFMAKRADCQRCVFKSHCLSQSSKTHCGRRITARCKRLDADDETTPSQACPDPPASGVPEPSSQRLLYQLIERGEQPILWQDLPARQLRTRFSQRLRRQQVKVVCLAGERPPAPQRPPYLTRAARAHHRLTWQQRLYRNALKPEDPHWQVEVHGVSQQLATLLCSSEPQAG